MASTWFNQLKVLLWKNYVLRVRHPFRTFLELCLPLVFFIILCFVRKRVQVVQEDTDYHAPFALPSAGMVPFVYSMLCNTRSSHDGDNSPLPNYTDKLFGRVLDIFDEVSHDASAQTCISTLPKNLSRLIALTGELYPLVSKQWNISSFLASPDDVFGNIGPMAGLDKGDWDSLMRSPFSISSVATAILRNSSVESLLKLLPLFTHGGPLDPLSGKKLDLSSLILSSTVDYGICAGSYISPFIGLKPEIWTKLQSQLCNLNYIQKLSLLLSLRTLLVHVPSDMMLDIVSLKTKIGEINSSYVDFERNLGCLTKYSSDVMDILDSIKTSNYHSMNEILCHTSMKPRQHKTKPNLNPAAFLTQGGINFIKLIAVSANLIPWLNSSSSVEPPTSESSSPNIPSGGSPAGNCSVENDVEDVDCGWPGINMDICHAFGCCFNGSHSKVCVYKRDDRQFGAAMQSLIRNSAGAYGIPGDYEGSFYVNAMNFFTRSSVLITPDSPQTRQIKDRLDAFLKKIEYGLREILNMSSTIQDLSLSFSLLTFISEQLQYPMDGWTGLSSDDSATLEYSHPMRELGINVNTDRQQYIIMNRFDGPFKSLAESLSVIKQYSGTRERFVLVDTEEKLLHRASDPKQVPIIAGLVFPDLDAEDGSFPPVVKYKIRQYPNFIPDTRKPYQRIWEQGKGKIDEGLLYLRFGFLFLQDLVDHAIINLVTNKTAFGTGEYVRLVPTPCFLRNNFTKVIGTVLPLLIIVAWVFSVSFFVKLIVYEKELQLRDVMKVMGLSDSVQWLAWFLSALAMLTLSVGLMVLIIHVGSILEHSSMLLLFFILFSFSVSVIMMCFLVSTFFMFANIAAASAPLIYLTTYLPYSLVFWFEESMPFGVQLSLTSLSCTNCGLMFSILSRWEEQAIGAHFSNLFDYAHANDSISIGMCICMMWLDSLIYLLLTFYFDAVLNRTRNERLSPYFILMPSFWKQFFSNSFTCFQKHPELDVSSLEDEELLLLEDDHRNVPGLVQNYGVEVKNLTKVYGNRKAVDGLCLALPRNQITVLLGHNGAGKSTTMSMIVGIVSPTSGQVLVEGKSYQEHPVSIRKQLGLCPQYNVLFSELTVEEHLYFYGLLKGLSSQEIKNELQSFLDDVGLPKKRFTYTRLLSGGMKRKLSVALAFIGQTTVAILDEPTAGVDPYSRRSIWELIMKHKKGRTILLSTHHMDEADMLGDTIALMSRGRIHSQGTQIELKRKYGSGLRLAVEKEMAAFNLDVFMAHVSKIVSGAIIAVNTDQECCLLIPLSNRDSGALVQLLESLEHRDIPGVKEYGVYDSALEEVFMKVFEDGKDNSEDFNGQDFNYGRSGHDFMDSLKLHSARTALSGPCTVPSVSSNNVLSTDYLTGSSSGGSVMTLTGASLLFTQLVTFIGNRFTHSRRNRKVFLSQILLPVVFMIMAMSVTALRPGVVILPALELSLNQYNSYMDLNVMMSSQSGDLDTITLVENTLQPYFGFPSHRKKVEGVHLDWSPANLHTLGNTSSVCQCDGSLKCQSVHNIEIDRIQLAKNTKASWLGNVSISDYWIQTYHSFNRLRYGGLDYGYKLQCLNLSHHPNINDYITPPLCTSKVTQIWYDNRAFHALPMFVNAHHNAILRQNLPNPKDGVHKGIITYNHPLLADKSLLVEWIMKEGISSMVSAILMNAALAFVPASVLVYLISDRTSRSKHLQFVSGLHPLIYWLGCYLWDLIVFFIPVACAILVLLAFKQEAYIGEDSFPATILVLVLYGWAITPLMYPLSLLFEIPSVGYIIMLSINIFIGFITVMSTFILDYLSYQEDLRRVNEILKKVFLALPNFCIGRTFLDLAINNLHRKSDPFTAVSDYKSPLSWEVAGDKIVALVVSGIIYFVITLIVEITSFDRIVSILLSLRKRTEPQHVSDDDDVIIESRKVSHKEGLVVQAFNLTKVYHSFYKEDLVAVDGVCLGVEKGECFGLLGTNGAGKTSTFQMLTGESSPTNGIIKVCNYRMDSQRSSVYRRIGYCPQFDALDLLLTGREHLQYYCRVRGVLPQYINMVTQDALALFNLEKYADVVCKNYSGGNRRKLSTALAFLGNPEILFMDEPTTGMDPAARRDLWNVINLVVSTGRSVVLTSHSMEECEAVCTRLTIMVNGRFQCLGTPLHLKAKYGRGYTLSVRCNAPNLQTEARILQTFPNAICKNHQQNILEFQICDMDLKLSILFCLMEALRKDGSVEDYSISQTSLDQVFVNIARRQDCSSPEISARDTAGSSDDVPLSEA